MEPRNRINDDAPVTLSKCRVMMPSDLRCRFWLPSVAVPRMRVDVYQFNRRLLSLREKRRGG